MDLILTVLAFGIVFGKRASKEEEECLNRCFLGLLLIDFLAEGDCEVEDEVENSD